MLRVKLSCTWSLLLKPDIWCIYIPKQCLIMDVLLWNSQEVNFWLGAFWMISCLNESQVSCRKAVSSLLTSRASIPSLFGAVCFVVCLCDVSKLAVRWGSPLLRWGWYMSLGDYWHCPVERPGFLSRGSRYPGSTHQRLPYCCELKDVWHFIHSFTHSFYCL